MRRPLDQRQVDALAMLPAVASVTRDRINYTEAFKRHAMRRYRHGDRPVDIFRQAGLDPRIIGNKRIERCIARWKQDIPDNSASGDGDTDPTPTPAALERIHAVTPADARLLAANARRIEELASRIDALEQAVGLGRAS